MHVWLDDERQMPQGYDVHVRTAPEAISLLAKGIVKFISLDHDLGEGAGTGYEVAKWIEQNAFEGTLTPVTWSVHSANTVGRQNMIAALKNANRFWRIS